MAMKTMDFDFYEIKYCSNHNNTNLFLCYHLLQLHCTVSEAINLNLNDTKQI